MPQRKLKRYFYISKVRKEAWVSKGRSSHKSLVSPDRHTQVLGFLYPSM